MSEDKNYNPSDILKQNNTDSFLYKYKYPIIGAVVFFMLLTLFLAFLIWHNRS